MSEAESVNLEGWQAKGRGHTTSRPLSFQRKAKMLDSVRRHFQDFASETEFHGFSDILRSPKQWATLWSFIVIIAIALFANDFLYLIKVYKAEPTDVAVEILSNSDKPFPTPTFCMEVAHTNNKWNISNLDYEIDDFLTATNNTNNLNFIRNENLSLSKQLEYYTHTMLGLITDFELSYTAVAPDFLSIYAKKFKSVLSVSKSDWAHTLQYIFNSYRLRNVSFPKLKRLIGMQICQNRTSGQLENFQFSEYETAEVLPLCVPELITYVGSSLVCSKLLNSTNVQTKPNFNSFAIKLTGVTPTSASDIGELARALEDPTYSIEDINTNDGNENGIDGSLSAKNAKLYEEYNVNYAFHLDFQGRPTLPKNGRNNIFTWNPRKMVALDVSIGQEFQFYNAKIRPCATETQYSCEWRQRLEQMYNTCKCVPSALIHLVDTSNTKPYCTESRSDSFILELINETASYPSCVKDGMAGIQSNFTCLQECDILSIKLEPREPKTFRWNFLDDTWDGVPGSIEFTFQYTTLRSQIVESSSKNWVNFMCEFGGSLGTWLGFFSIKLNQFCYMIHLY